MKSKTVFSIVLFAIASCLSIQAQTVSPEAARAKALDFFNNGAKNVPTEDGLRRAAPRVRNVELAYTSEKDGKTCFYVYNNGENGGFVIVGGDEVAKEILAYVPQGHFDYEKAPDNVKWWLGQYENEIDTAIIINTKVPLSIPKKTAVNSSWTDIPDMITTKWNQGNPYNNAIPCIVVDDNPVHSPTGCVPTALAQIMNYWQYPLHGIGSKSYATTYTDIDQTISFSADFENTTYDWNNMKDTYVDGQYTQEEAQAVSTLMYHIGVAIGVSYGQYETGYSSSDNISEYNGTIGLMCDLPEYFGYDEGLQKIGREDFTLDQWKTLLYNELSAGRPVYYSGTGDKGGHAFVCHGYSSDLDMFSFNWGWGGLEDGYFALSGTNAVNGFSANHEEMLIGIRPKGYNPGTAELTFGDKFMSDGIWYKVWDERNKEVEVTHTQIVDVWGSPTYDDDYGNYLSGDVNIPSVVHYNGVDYTVSRIGVSAFRNNGHTNVTSVTLPSTITSLAAGAFYYCQSLTDSIIIPDAVEIIPKRCFEQCNRLPYINIPTSVERISKLAFYGCSLLERISLPEGCYKVSSSAFSDCNSLSVVDLPSTMRILEAGCFKGTSLIKMVFPCENFVPVQYYTDGDYTVISIQSPFPNSIVKGSLYVPASLVDTYRNTTDEHWKKWGNVESIDNINPYIGTRFVVDDYEYIVLNDTSVSLVSVKDVDYSKQCMTVPSTVYHDARFYNVESLSAGAFSYQGFGVKGIEKLILSEGIKEIGESALRDCDFKVIELPSSLEKIGRNAFYCCNGLESLDIPARVKIANGIALCPSLKQVILHEGTKCVGPNFLERCPNLKDVYFPSTLKYSAGGTLVDCNSLNSIVSLTDSLSVAPFKIEWNENSYEELGDLVGEYAIGYGSNHESVKLYVLESYLQDSSSDYNNNYPWNDFPNKLVYVPMESFEISNSIDVTVNEQRMIPHQFFPSNASYKQLKWTSSNEDIATVNCEGYVYAKAEGEVTITAYSIDGSNINQTCVVRVHPSSVPANERDFSMYDSDFRYYADYSMQQDTLSIPITSDGGELYFAFDISRENDGNNLFCSLGNQKYDIIPTGDKTIVLHFENVQEQDTIRIFWNKVYVYSQYLTISNIRVWNRYPHGDVNLDERVDVTDAVDIVNDRLGYESTGFVRALSDVNKDQLYTVADAIGVINIMYGEPVGRLAAPRTVQSQGESYLDLNLSNNNTVAVNMNCTDSYSAFQFDIELPVGIDLEDISLNCDRCQGFAVQYNRVKDNRYTVVAYNFANESLKAGSGNLLLMTLSGSNVSDEVKLSNIHFSTCMATDVSFKDMTLSLTATGILNNVNDSQNDRDVYYNINGQRILTPANGIYIRNGEKVINQK